MFGYITVNQQELKLKDFDLYRSFYCGLCHTLKNRYGRRGQLLLNYDMTFLAILLSGLYEPPLTREAKRCIVHPVNRHQEIKNEAIEYAADMTVLLSYEKACDDWNDDRSLAGKALTLLLAEDVKKLKSRWPRQYQTLHECVGKLAQEEKMNCADPDKVAGLTGRFMAEIFVWKEDEWQRDLKNIGFYLGKFIYLMDAFDDQEKDKAGKRYNLFLAMKEEKAEGAYREMEMMRDTIGMCAAAYERLPIVEYTDILRNILYAGVWMRAAAKMKKQQSNENSRKRKCK